MKLWICWHVEFLSCCFHTVTYEFIQLQLCYCCWNRWNKCWKFVSDSLYHYPWCGILSLIKEKSWSVKLANGYILDSKVQADRCKGCESTPKLVAWNKDDQNLLLYGCYGHRCKHVLLRIKVPDAYPPVSIQNNVFLNPLITDFQEIAPTTWFGFDLFLVFCHCILVVITKL